MAVRGEVGNMEVLLILMNGSNTLFNSLSRDSGMEYARVSPIRREGWAGGVFQQSKHLFLLGWHMFVYTELGVCTLGYRYNTHFW